MLKTLDPQPPEGWSSLPALMVRTDTWVLLLQPDLPHWPVMERHTGTQPSPSDSSTWPRKDRLLDPSARAHTSLASATVKCLQPQPPRAHLPGRGRRQVRQG